MGDLFAKISREIRRLAFLLALALAVLGGAIAPARAQNAIPTADDAVASRQTTLQASQDAYVYSLAADTNFGAAEELLVTRGGNLGPAPIFANALFQFPLPQFPVYTNIESATLLLYQTSGGDGRTWEMPIGRITESWDEGDVTYSNLPASVATGLSVTGAAEESAILLTEIGSEVQGWVRNGGGDNFGLYVGGTGTLARERTFASREASATANRPTLSIAYTLPPVRVCLIQNDTCPVAANALVHNLTTGAVYQTDANGFVSRDDLGTIGVGDRLWARIAVASANGGTQYHVQGAAVPAIDSAYMGIGDAQELRLVIDETQSLWVQDLEISAQWHVEGDAAYAATLARRFIQASSYLYAFTDGQFALGNVRIRQNYDGWDAANMQIHANNTLRPRAVIGGLVASETPDFNAAIPISYTTGPISMGSYWNRFGTPPNAQNTVDGVPFPESSMVADWPLALAHELGHWLLFLFDTYTGIDGNASVELAELCTGTAMGNVYEPGNHGFIFSPDDWVARCSGTEAYGRLNGRTEWATIAGWYPWVQIPSAFIEGPSLPPGVTSVGYIPPATVPGAAAAQLFDLEYQNGESSSGEARAFLMRNERIIEQGKPAKESTQVQLTGAEIGDRLCVYDINDHSEGDETPRHQFGCEVIAAGDDTLVMTRDQSWSPQVALQQIGADQVQIVVTATLNGAAANQLRVRLFPEHESGMDEVLLPHAGNVYSTTVTIAGGVPPLFAQVYVGETPAAPQSRREVVADRGTGGGGAFGPARLYGDVLVMSSDGNASFEGEGSLELEAGESIAWQSMPGTPPIPYTLQVLGQSYRLDAFPADLVEEGTVRIRYQEPPGTASATVSPTSSAGSSGVRIWFWDGMIWSALATDVVTPVNAVDGIRLASAPSAGVGVYAVMMPSENDNHRFLPAIAVE